MGVIQAEVALIAQRLGIREVEFWTIANSCLTDVRAAWPKYLDYWRRNREPQGN
jgi:siderophore synthetase component